MQKKHKSAKGCSQTKESSQEYIPFLPGRQSEGLSWHCFFNLFWKLLSCWGCRTVRGRHCQSVRKKRFSYIRNFVMTKCVCWSLKLWGFVLGGGWNVWYDWWYHNHANLNNPLTVNPAENKQAVIVKQVLHNVSLISKIKGDRLHWKCQNLEKSKTNVKKKL